MNKKAFTLLELLMVVIIIGILATLAVPQYQNFREKAIAAEAIRICGAWIKEAKLSHIGGHLFPLFCGLQLIRRIGTLAPLATVGP